MYYCTELAFSGGADPSNREDLWRSGYNTNSDLYQAIAKLTAARKAAGGLAADDQVHLYVADTAYAFGRAGGNLIVLTVNSGSGSSAQHCFNTQKASGSWTNAFGSGTYTSDSSGKVCITVSNGEPVVLLAAGLSTTTSATTGRLVSATATATTLVASSTSCPTAVAVTFTEKVTTAYGDTIKLSGSSSQLGSWNAGSALTLSAAQYTSSNPVWTLTLSMSPGQTVSYKFIKVSSSGTVTWESDPNRSLTVPSCAASTAAASEWK